MSCVDDNNAAVLGGLVANMDIINNIRRPTKRELKRRAIYWARVVKPDGIWEDYVGVGNAEGGV